jgi:hypothetical protein
MKFPGVVHDQDLVVRWGRRYVSRHSIVDVNDNTPDSSISEDEAEQIIDILFTSLAQWREDALTQRAREGTAIDEDEEPLSSSDEFEVEVTKNEGSAVGKSQEKSSSETDEKAKKAAAGATSSSSTHVPQKSSSWVRWWRSGRSDSTSVVTTGAGSQTGTGNGDEDVGSMSARDAAAAAGAGLAATSGSLKAEDIDREQTTVLRPPRPHIIASSSTPIQAVSDHVIVFRF